MTWMISGVSLIFGNRYMERTEQLIQNKCANHGCKKVLQLAAHRKVNPEDGTPLQDGAPVRWLSWSQELQFHVWTVLVDISN